MELLLFVVLGWISTSPLAGQDREIPFEFLHNQIVLSVSVNGKGPYSFVLDTGTHQATVDLALAKRLHLPLASKTEGSGAGSRRISGRQTVLQELRLGFVTAQNMPANALDLSAVSQRLGRPLHGVLGFGFLNSRVVGIDYFRRRIRFYKRSPFSPPLAASTPRRIAFPMHLLPGSVLPVLDDCYINGTRMPVTIDTGSSLGLILFPQAIRRLGLEKLAQQGIPLDAAGYRGNARLLKGWIRSVVFGSIDLGAIEVAYASRGYGDQETIDRRGGNIGNAVLQDFTLTLDYLNRIVTLEALEP